MATVLSVREVVAAGDELEVALADAVVELVAAGDGLELELELGGDDGWIPHSPSSIKLGICTDPDT